MKLTFLFPQGPRIVVRRLRRAPSWALGGRLWGHSGGFFGFGGRRILLYFKGAVRHGELVAIWQVSPRRVRLYPPPASARVDATLCPVTKAR